MALEYQDPQTDGYSLPLAQLTEEETYERELRKTQVIKAAPATKTCSVFEDPADLLAENKPQS